MLAVATSELIRGSMVIHSLIQSESFNGCPQDCSRAAPPWKRQLHPTTTLDSANSMDEHLMAQAPDRQAHRCVHGGNLKMDWKCDAYFGMDFEMLDY